MRIVVAMSGGVDSSTVAGLLHEAGHEVVGVTLQLYDHGAAIGHGAATGRQRACCAGQDIHDARRVADHLGIPHYTIDAEQRFADAVIADFAAGYAAGETPVPCVRCNQTVKFTDLTALARGLGAERLATGHYVRRIDGLSGPELHRAADLGRDQSWFLFANTSQQLDFALFPLGEMADKQAVRAEAARLGLPVAAKPDSQDICFVPSGHYADAVVRLRPDAGAPGEIVSRDGRVLGRHNGVARYTVGQGKRLGAASVDRGQRQVVVALEPGQQRVIVGARDAGTRVFYLREVNWLVPLPAEPIACHVQLRAREVPQPATVEVTSHGTEVRLDSPALPAPGQACVFYDGARVLGGGFIRRSEEAAVVDVAGNRGLSASLRRMDGGVAQR
jgi:tRNA-uridine 2-sulfurtransferase